jgi:Fe2+ transport system protein FeoA
MARIPRLAILSQERTYDFFRGRAVTLDQLRPRQPAIIAGIVHDESGHWRKLASLGIMPGETIEVRQRWPAIVVRVGLTEVGLDEQTAKLVTLNGAEAEQ